MSDERSTIGANGIEPVVRREIGAIDMGVGIGQVSRRSVEANVILCCVVCLAPGRYRHDRLTRDGYGDAEVAEALATDPNTHGKAHFLRAGWPSCYVEQGDPREGQPVGDICPQCGAPRPPHVYLGEISVTEFN